MRGKGYLVGAKRRIGNEDCRFRCGKVADCACALGAGGRRLGTLG